MNSVLVRNWWALVLRGVLAVLFGLIAFAMPGITLAVLVLLFGGYAVADGIFAIIAGIRAAGRRERWWPFVLEGILDLFAGLVAFVVPLATALALLYVVAFWAVVTGVLRIIAALRLRKEIQGEWLLVLSGVLAVIFGVLLVARPALGLVTLVWLIGAYAIVVGIALIGLGFWLRGHRGPVGAARSAATP
jgi:uncharacterized membrane protein HdeD (DUF308 family)